MGIQHRQHEMVVAPDGVKLLDVHGGTDVTGIDLTPFIGERYEERVKVVHDFRTEQYGMSDDSDLCNEVVITFDVCGIGDMDKPDLSGKVSPFAQLTKSGLVLYHNHECKSVIADLRPYVFRNAIQTNYTHTNAEGTILGYSPELSISVTFLPTWLYYIRG